MARLIGKKAMHHVVSHIDGVKKAVHDEAEKIGVKAEASLSAHRKSGEHEITVTQGETDSFVNLEGVHPESVEFGHWVEGKFKTDPPKFAKGLYILTGAADFDTTPVQGARRSGK